MFLYWINYVIRCIVSIQLPHLPASPPQCSATATGGGWLSVVEKNMALVSVFHLNSGVHHLLTLRLGDKMIIHLRRLVGCSASQQVLLSTALVR